MLPSHALGIIANTSFLEKKCACMPFDVMFTIYFDTQIQVMDRPQTLNMADGRRISAVYALLVVFPATASLP